MMVIGLVKHICVCAPRKRYSETIDLINIKRELVCVCVLAGDQ